MLERIQDLYRAYDDEFRQLEENRKLGAGMFGLGGGPRDYPCHQQFSQKLEALLREAEQLPPEQTAKLLSCIYFAPRERKEGQDAVYWMLMAVHGMTEGLVSRLAPEDAAGLLARYEREYPRRTWLPAQKKLVSALKKRAKR